MDVVKLFALVLFCSLLTACPSMGSKSNDNNKATSVCVNEAISNEKIVRWKNGKISRLVLKDVNGAAERYREKYSDQIESMEDNYRISRPVVNPLALSTFRVASINWGADEINAPELWNKNVYGDGVVVATVDSGIDMTHPQLRNQMYKNPGEIAGNGIDDDGNGLIDDVSGYDYTSNQGALSDTTGHGTHVAGIIAADHVNGPMRGVAPHAKLIVYDFFGNSGDGSVFNAIKALRAASAMGAKVINASWGGPGCSLALKSEIEALSRKDILFIVAAGNDNWNIDYTPAYPAAFSSVSGQITVGAMTSDELTAGFSNYGKKVHLMAPGESIISTWPGNKYQNEDGTSMAAPFVTGSAVLLRSAFPKATAIDIKAAILASVKSGPYPVATKGSIDVAAAYEVLADQFGAAQAAPLR